jgi:hypothetical protein
VLSLGPTAFLNDLLRQPVKPEVGAPRKAGDHAPDDEGMGEAAPASKSGSGRVGDEPENRDYFAVTAALELNYIFGAHGSRTRKPSMPDLQLSISELDERIAALRENLRELVEQAAAESGDAIEESISRRISEQEVQLDTLMKQRDELLG